MSGELDFPQRTEETTGGDRSPEPVVVLQYRRSWISRLSTPLLILIAAVAVVSHRVKLDDWRGLGGWFPMAEAHGPEITTDRPDPPSAPIALAVPDPVVLKDAPAWKLDASSRLPAPPRPRISPPLPFAVAPRPIRLPESTVSAAKVWEDIRQEAAKSQEEAIAMQAVKARENAEVERLAPLAQNAIGRPGSLESEDDRVKFREELRLAVAGPLAQAGAAIKDLCDQHGVFLGTEPRRKGGTKSIGLTASGRCHRVDLMRAKGLSEASILEDLVRFESLNVVARGGPKTPDEVIVRASKNLLALPVRPPSPPRETR